MLITRQIAITSSRFVFFFPRTISIRTLRSWAKSCMVICRRHARSDRDHYYYYTSLYYQSITVSTVLWSADVECGGDWRWWYRRLGTGNGRLGSAERGGWIMDKLRARPTVNDGTAYVVLRFASPCGGRVIEYRFLRASGRVHLDIVLES